MPPARPADKPERPAPAARSEPPVTSASIEVGFLKDVFAEITGARAAMTRQQTTDRGAEQRKHAGARPGREATSFDHP